MIQNANEGRFVPGRIVLAGIFAVGVLTCNADTNGVATDMSGKFLREHRGDIVIIKGKTSAGSGFVFTRAGRRFLVSNAHVMAGIKTPTFSPLDRSTLQFKPGPAVVAVGHDIIMMELQPGSNGIPLMESFETSVTVNDPIVVFGNSGGGDVATAINGKVRGIGPDRIEIDAEIEHGNSGSPIIHAPTGKVIGVATYATTDDLLSGEKKVRRFGYRMDTVKRWETLDWARFYVEAENLKKVEDITAELEQVSHELNGLNQRTNKFRVYAYESPVIRDALDKFYSALDRAETRRDANSAINNLLATLNNVRQNYPTSMKPTYTYEYFRQQFAEQEAVRAEAMRSLVSILQK